MAILLILHVQRVYLTGGSKRARELTWITGALLAALAASFAVTGYSLAWDQIGLWASKIVTAVPEAIDGLAREVGSVAIVVTRGGVSVGQGRLVRFYSAHTSILPLTSCGTVSIHFGGLRKQGIAGPS